jgi:hypothetical protein
MPMVKTFFAFYILREMKMLKSNFTKGNVMKKSEIKYLPEYFEQFIHLVEDEELIISFYKSLEIEKLINCPLLKANADNSYAFGKWTIKDVIQHLIDTERVFSYCALRIARNEQTKWYGFDDPMFCENTKAIWRDINDLLDELICVRRSSIMLFKSFKDEILIRKGKSIDGEINVLTLGFSIIGHQAHHFNVIKTKYFHQSEN